jgi:hypothetical protein
MNTPKSNAPPQLEVVAVRRAMLYLPDEPGYTPRIVDVTIERARQ